MAHRRPNGMVFISYAHDDRSRVEPLVQALAARFNVWWDKGIEIGEVWRQTLMDKLDSARCVVVVWTTTSVGRDFIWSEIDRVKSRNIVVAVKLDDNAKIPLGFDQIQHLDLTTWAGGGVKILNPLFTRIKLLLRRPVHPPSANLSNNSYVLRNSLHATGQLQRFSDRIRTISGILTSGAGPVDDLLGTLEEVHRTYSSVTDAISRFLAPAARVRNIDVKPYLEMERGQLLTHIENNRGHCTRIVEYYGRVGGLRDWLEPRLKKEKLKQLDDTFGRLGTADGDLFDALVSVGDVLTGEASEIASLLLRDQQDLARKRIIQGRTKLLPVERKLSDAMRKLQSIESSLGYVAPK